MDIVEHVHGREDKNLELAAVTIKTQLDHIRDLEAKLEAVTRERDSALAFQRGYADNAAGWMRRATVVEAALAERDRQVEALADECAQVAAMARNVFKGWESPTGYQEAAIRASLATVATRLEAALDSIKTSAPGREPSGGTGSLAATAGSGLGAAPEPLPAPGPAPYADMLSRSGGGGLSPAEMAALRETDRITLDQRLVTCRPAPTGERPRCDECGKKGVEVYPCSGDTYLCAPCIKRIRAAVGDDDDLPAAPPSVPPQEASEPPWATCGPSEEAREAGVKAPQEASEEEVEQTAKRLYEHDMREMPKGILSRKWKGALDASKEIYLRHARWHLTEMRRASVAQAVAAVEAGEMLDLPNGVQWDATRADLAAAREKLAGTQAALRQAVEALEDLHRGSLNSDCVTCVAIATARQALGEATPRLAPPKSDEPQP